MDEISRDGDETQMDTRLLASLGREAWASICLRNAIRHMINHLEGGDMESPFDAPLSVATAYLEQLTKAQSEGPDRAALLAWLDGPVKTAIRTHHGITHAFVVSDAHGRVTLHGNNLDRPVEYDEGELLAAAELLWAASRELPASIT